MKDRVFKKLPAIHQTDVLDAFFKTTIDQWFTEAEIIDVEGYAGRKVPGLYSPTQDFYIAEPSVTREHYQLEPTLVINDINTAEVDAVLFYDDVLRQLHTEGANIYHHDSLFASNAFSWAPPIDLDKFINYENYYWYDYGAPAIAVLGTMSAPLNVETDIIGKTTFTSANGITLTNGMRIIFTGAYITPELYRKSKSDKEFIVEGVGTSIKLIDVKSDDFDHTLSYIIQESETDHEWDTDFWDEVKWAVSIGTDGTELERRIDYVTIKRGAQNQNPWSRTNGWYHKDALMLVTGTATGEKYTTLEPRLWDDSDEVFDSEAWDATIKLHDELFSLDPARQAKRPIIEFDNNLELYDYGVEGLGSVTVACEDNYNTVHGATNPEVDGRVLEDNDTIIFLNTALLKQNPWDNDEWDPGSHPSGTQHPPGPYSAMPPGSIGNWDVVGALNATGIVYYVDINIFTGWCTLTEHKIVLSDQKVFVKAGIDYKGKEFWWDNDSWNLCQLKTKQNDEPLFHVYDANMNKLNSTYYPGSTSYGNKVFSYKESSSGVVDDYIGKSLEYKEFGQITDIVFVNNLEDAVSYEAGQINGYKYLNQYHLADGPTTLKEWGWDSNAWDYSVIEGSEEQQVILWDSGSLVHRNVEIDLVPPHNRISSTFINGWNETNQKSKQRVKETFTVETTGDSIFTLGSSPTVEVGLADIIVTVDGNVAKQSTSVLAHDYNIVGDVLTFTTNLQLTAGQVIDTRAVTIDIVDLLDKHYFEIPDNLEANPDNLDIVEASASELLDQFVSIIGNQEGIAGNSFGTNNYRDTIQDRSKGTKILQHDSSLLPLMHILSKRKDLKITESIRYNQTEYANFKSKFLQQVLFFVSQVDTTVISEFVDDVLDTMYRQRSNLSIFAEVPAICHGNSYTAIEHHPSYPTTYFMLDELLSDVDIENRKRVVYIYYTSPHAIATGSDKTLLINDIDYKFVQVEDEIGNIVTKVEFTNTLDRNSKLEIRLFDDIQNAFIPLTPSMVGSHSVYVPKKEIDDTYIDGNKTFIIGHDGSRILEFGDVRDDALMELEKRIFNSIPVKYTWEYLPELNYFDIMPGKYRTTSYTMFDVNIVMEPMLRRWGLEHSVDFHTHRTYDESLPFTWNYVTELDLDGKEVPGSWRGIYMYYYDTVRPHTHPWEMLGFSIKPSWWDGEYGSAPYTSINTLLWNDLELGIIKQGVRANLAFDKWDSPDNKFKRPSLANVIPVDLLGNLLDPVKAGIFGDPAVKIISGNYTVPHVTDRHLDWQIGDLAPVEYSARGNVDWPFILNKLFFLFKPAEYVTKHWDTLYIGKDTVNLAHTTFKDTRKRNRLQDYRIQSATTPVYGLQSWLKPYVLSQGKNYTTLIGDTLATTNVALGYKAGGFVSSNLKVIADSFSSLRTTENVFIPDENKIISLYDGFSQGIRVYSGVIVTVTESGFEISGFDQYSSVFSIIPSIQDGPSTAIVIDNMQVYRYDTAYDVIREIPYGYSYDNFNDVFDFLISYGRYLAHIGFVFDEFDHDTGALLDFEYSAKEFMGWVQLSPWEVGSFLALSPVAGTVKFNTAGVGDVANLTDIINNTYTVVDKDKKQIPTQDIVITRKADTFVVSTVANTGIYGLKLNPYKTEHVITFNNITDFNDLIYDPLLRLRQDRMKLNIKKTGNWTGKYEAPGYIIKSNDIIPNFDTTANNYRKYFDDTDTPLSQSLTDTGRHLIGYQTRDYLDNITENEDISFQFYKGMLLQKGNEQSLTKLLRSNRLGNDDITFYEEFAFKIGELGATDLQTQIEIALRTADVRVENPVIELTYDDNIIDTLNDDITQINYYNDSRWIEKPEMPLTTVWPTLPVGYTGDNWLPSAGYVHNDDIKYRAFDPATLASLNTVSRDTAEPQLGELAHIAKTYNDQFGVFKLVDTGLKVESAELLDTGKTRVSVIGEIIPTIVGNSSLISPDISSVASRTGYSPLTANASDITTARIGDEINIELNGGEKAGGSNFKILLGTASLVADSDPTVTFNTSRVSSITKDTSIFINDVEVIFAKIPPGPFSKICRVINPKIKLTNACTINSTPIIFVANDQLTTPGESTDTGKLQAGATSAITLAKGANITHNFYKNQTVEIISGTGIGQVRTIIDYRGDTKVAEVDTAWDIQPDDTSGYTITIKGWPGGIIANINANIFGVDAYDMNGYLLLKSPAASLTFNAHHSTVNTDIGLAEGIHHNEMSVIEILDAINTTSIPDIFATIENNNNNIAVTGIGINKVECRRGTGNAHQVLFPSKTSGVDVTTNKVVADNRLITLDDVIADIEAAGLPDGFTAIKDLDGNIKFTYNGNSMHVSGSALSGIGMQSTAMVITASSVVKHMFKHGDVVVLTDILTKKGKLLDINAGQLIEEETVYIHKTVDIVNGIVTIFDLITNESTVLTDVNKIPIYTINVADRDYVENFAISIVAPVAPSEISVGDSKVKDSILPAFVNKDAKGYSTGKIGPYATLFENEGTINIFSHSHNNFISGNFTVSMTVKKKGIFIIDDLMMTALGLQDTTSDNIKYWHPRRFNTKADAVSDVREYRSFYDIGDIVWVDNEDSGYIVGKVKDLQNHYALTATMLTSSGHGYTPDDIGRNFTINTYDTETITPPVCEITNIDFGIGSVTVTEGGAGYTSPPMVTFTGVDTTKPASAVAVLATEILSINITNPGGGYKTIPLVEIYESPIYNGAIWNVEHNLGQQLVNLEISDYEHNVVNFVYEGPTITYVDENNLTIDWHGEVTVGYIDVIKSEYFSSLFIEENTWLVYHNLGQQYVTVDIIYGDFTGLPGRFDHPIIEYTTANMLRVIFPKNVTASGYVAATFCDGNDIVNDGHVHTASAASNVWNVTHNLGKRHVNIDVAFAGSDIEFFDVGNLTTVAHNLHSRCVNIELVDADNKVIYNTYNPTIVEFVDDDSFELISGARSVERVNVIKPRYISPVQSVIAFVDANTLRLPAQSVVAVTKVNIIKSNFVSSLQPASNVWTVAHGLGQAIVNIDIIYADDSSARSTYNQPIVEYFDPNTVRIIFPTDVSASGYVVASHCNTTNTSGTGYDHDESAAPATTWTVAHNLGSKYVNVDIAVLGTSIQSADVTASIDSAKYYNIKSLYDYPVIKYIDANNLTITFSSATAGKAVISGGTTITPSGTSATHIIHGLGQQYVNFELVSNADEVVHNVYNQGTDKWVINHNLNKTITNVDIIYNDYKSANSKFDHPLVEYTNSNTVTILFPEGVARDGYVAISHNDSNSATPGFGYEHTETTAATVWNVAHNLGSIYANVDIAVPGSAIDFTYRDFIIDILHSLSQRLVNTEFIDANNKVVNNVYDQTKIECVDTDNLRAYISGNTSISKINIVPSNFVSSLQPASNVWTVSHSLATDIVNVDVIYDDYTIAKATYDQPIIEYTDDNNVKVIFPTGIQQAGYVAVGGGGGTGTGTNVINFDVEWITAQTGQLNPVTSTHPWTVSSDNLTIRYDVEDSLNCGGSNDNVQTGTAEATITIGAVDVNMKLDFEGVGEMEHPDFEKITFKLDGTVIADAHAAGGGLGCTMGPVVKSGSSAQATADVIVQGDQVVHVFVLQGGAGYDPQAAPPTVTISAPTSGVTATAEAIVDPAGFILGYTVTNPGSGYAGTTPTVTIDPPPSGIVGFPLYLPLLAGTTHVLEIDFTTNDHLYHVDAYYEAQLEFEVASTGGGGGGGTVPYDVLRGVTRGTLGTSAIAHIDATTVVDGGRRQQIPGVPDYWDYLNTIDSSVTALAHTHTAFNDLGATLQSSTNAEANFINAVDGIIWENT